MTELLQYLFEVSICLILFYAFYKIFLERSLEFRYNRFFLLFTYLCSFCIPLLSFKVIPVTLKKSVVSSNPDLELAAPIVSESHKLITWDQVLIGIYLLIAILMLIRLIHALKNIWQQIKTSEMSHHPICQFIYYDGDKPYSFFKYLFYPSDIPLHKEIIEHELTHIQEYHSYDIVLSEFVKVILWFNPIAYLIQKDIKINHEFICDKKASGIHGKYKYVQLLAGLHHKKYKYHLGNNFSYFLKNRIIMLEQKYNHPQKWKYLLIFPLVFLMLNLFSFDKYYIIENDNIQILNDSIPIGVDAANPYFLKEIIDTTTIFNSETYEETFTVVKSRIPYVMVEDTVAIFDFDTKEEKISIVKKEVPMLEYIEQQEKNKVVVGTDTILVFDSDTYEETVSVIERTGDCYDLNWGESYFSGSNDIGSGEFRLLLTKSLNIHPSDKDCERVRSFKMNFVVVPKDKDPIMMPLNKERNKLNREKIPDNYLRAGTTVFIDKINVNGNKKVASVIFKIL